MKLFLSWSGNRSKALAEVLKNWIPQLIQAVEPWISLDIEKGRRWGPEIADQLEGSRVGIICLTRDNLGAPWLLFEAGALSKTKDAYVCTLLLDISPADLKPPLGDFQHTTLERDDIIKLFHTIRVIVLNANEKAPSELVLDALFNKLWVDLQDDLNKILTKPSGSNTPLRQDREILEEMLLILRDLQRRQTLLEFKDDPEAIELIMKSKGLDEDEARKVWNHLYKVIRSMSENLKDTR